MALYSSDVTFRPVEMRCARDMEKSPTCVMNLLTLLSELSPTGSAESEDFAMLDSRISLAARPFCSVAVLA